MGIAPTTPLVPIGPEELRKTSACPWSVVGVCSGEVRKAIHNVGMVPVASLVLALRAITWRFAKEALACYFALALASSESVTFLTLALALAFG